MYSPPQDLPVRTSRNSTLQICKAPDLQSSLFGDLQNSRFALQNPELQLCKAPYLENSRTPNCKAPYLENSRTPDLPRSISRICRAPYLENSRCWGVQIWSSGLGIFLRFGGMEFWKSGVHAFEILELLKSIVLEVFLPIYLPKYANILEKLTL